MDNQHTPFEDIPWWMSSDTRLPEYVAIRIGFRRSPDHGLLEISFCDLRPDVLDEFS